MPEFKVDINTLPDKQDLSRKPFSVDTSSLPDKKPLAPVKEDSAGFFEKAYNSLFEKAQSLGELILGDKANKKAPAKPALLDTEGEDLSVREVFLKNASKQLYGTTPQTLSDDPFAEHTFLRNVRQVAASQEKAYKETLKSDLPWEEKSKQLTKLNEDYSKPYLDEKNRLNKQLEEVNSKLEKLKNISKTIQTQQEYTGKDYTYYPYKYEEDKLFEQKSKEGLTLSDVGNEEATLLKVKKDLESKLSENEKDKINLQKTLTSPSFYINPLAEATRNSPDDLLSLDQEDLGFQLAKMQAEIESMDNEEKKQGRLYPYNTSINGKEVKDLLKEKVVINNSNLFNWADRIASYFRDTPGGVETEYIEEKLGSSPGTTTGGVIRKIQEDAYNGANSLGANIEANKKSYNEAIKTLQNFKLEQLKKAKEENKTVSPEWENQINQEISKYSDLLLKQDNLLKKIEAFKDTYLKNYKDFEDYKAERDNYAKSWNILDDLISPALINPSIKVASIPQALSSYKDAALTSTGLMSKEEQTARQLNTFYSNEANPFTYIPEPIKNQEAFKLKEGQSISDITLDNFNLRSTFREGIKTTIESLLLYKTGVYIGELSNLSNVLSKGGTVAKYFSDKIGIIPASNLLLNQDIQKENIELYLDGSLNSINEVLGRTEGQKFIEGATEMLWTPEANLLNSVTKQPLQEFALRQIFKKSLGQELVTPELKYLTQSIIKNLVATPFEESFEEIVGNKATDWLNEYSKNRNLTYNPEKQFTLLNNFETAVNTTIGMLPTMLFSLGKSYTDRYKYLSSISYEVGANADELFKYAQDYILNADEQDLRKIFPNFVSKSDLIKKVEATNNAYKQAYIDASPITSKLLEESDKIDYFNTIYTYNQLVKDPDQAKENLEEIENLQQSILKIKDGVAKRELEYKKDYKKALSKDLPTLLSSFDYNSVNIPTLQEIDKHLENLKDKLSSYDGAYKNEIEAIQNRQNQVVFKINALKDAALQLDKSPEQIAQENNAKGVVTVQRQDKPFNIELNTPYYLSTIEDISTDGKVIKERPLITVLKDNGDGTVDISTNGELSSMPISELSNYKLTKKSTVDNWRKNNTPEAFVFDHENDVFSYEFSKETDARDKAPKGRIQYNPLYKSVEFVYKDKKGSVQRQVLSKSDLRNINKGKLKYVRTLETEAEFNAKQAKIQENINKINLNLLEEQTLRRWDFIQNFIKEKLQELENTKKLISSVEDSLLQTEIEIEELQNKLSSKSNLTTKKGKKRVDVQKLFNKLNKLSNEKRELENTVIQQEQKKQDLESQIEYTKKYEDVDFESEKSLVDQLIEDQFDLELQLEQVNSFIDSFRNLISKIEDTIQSLLSNIDSLVNIANRLYPGISLNPTKWTDFVRNNPNISKLQPDFAKDLYEFNEIINNNLDKIELEDAKIDNAKKQIKASTDLAKNLQSKIRYQEELINSAIKSQKEFEEGKTIAKINSIANEIFKNQTEKQTSNQLNTSEEDQKLVKEESDKIDILEFFSTTTSGVDFAGDLNLDNPAVLRLQNFLNSVVNISEFSLLAVTKDNAKKYGLEEILFSDNTTTNKTDLESDNDIKFVIVKIDPTTNNIQFVDESGKNIAPTKNNVVYTTLRKASLKWSDGQKAYSSKLNQNEKEENELVNKLEESHKTLRQNIINSVKSGNTAVFGIKYISRGRNTQNTDVPNSVVGTVVDASVNLSTTQVIQIPSSTNQTTPVIYMGNKAIPMPTGRPVISHNQFFEFLNEKKFNSKDVDKFIKVFKALYDAYKSNNRQNTEVLLTFLQKTLYFRDPNKLSKTTNQPQSTDIGRSQIWFSNEDGVIYLNLSKDYKIPFNFEENNTKAFVTLQAFFQGKDLADVYHNVDNQDLIGKPFIEIIDVDKEGNLITREWNSYQEYLISNKYPNGQQRPIEEIPLTVNINSSTPNTPNKAGRNIIFDNKTNQSVTSSAKKSVIQTQKENVELPIVNIDENTQFEESVSPVQDLTKLTVNKLYRWSVQKDGETKFIDFSISDKGFVKVFASNWGKNLQDLAKNLQDYTSGKQKKPLTVVIFELTPISKPEVKSSFTPIEESESTSSWVSLTKSSTTPVSDFPTSSVDVDELLKGFEPDYSPDDNDVNYRKAIKKSYKLENLEKAKQWLQERFPQIDFKLVVGLIDGKAWGRLKGSVVTLSDVAEEGTVYHEAFEVVHKYILSPKQLKSLYSEFKRRKGSFIDYETGNTVEYSKASDYQIKEQMAEEYREYELTGKKWEGEYHKNSLFRKIKNFIDFLLNGLKNPETIQEVFEKISNGAYKDHNITFNTENLPSNYKLAEVKTTNPTLYNDIMKSITNLMFEVLSSQKRSIPEVLTDNYDIEAEHQLIKSKIDNFFGGKAAVNLIKPFTKESFIKTFTNKDNLKKLLSTISKNTPVLYKNLQQFNKQNPLNEQALIEKVYDVLNNYSFIDENWEEIKKDHLSFLAKYSIEFKEESIELDDNITSDENKDQNDYTRDVLKLNRKLNANTEIKLLLATLRDMEWVDNTPDFFVLNAKRDKQSKLNSLLMSNLVDYNKTIISLLYKLSPATTFDEMVEILKKEAKSNASLDQLLEKLKAEVPVEQLTEFDIELQSKFFTSLNNMQVKYKKLILDPQTKTGAPVDLNEENALNIVKTKWFNTTRANTKLFYTDKEGNKKLNKSALPVTTIRSMEDAISFLNSLGYEFKFNTDKLSTEQKEQLIKSSLNLFKVLTTNDPELIMYNSPLVRENLNELAEIYIENTDNYAEPQHLNIDREPVQNIILHNFIGIIAKSFNISNKFEDFLAKIPQLNPNSENNAWLSYSQILSPNSEFFKDGKRTKKISIEIIEGSEVRESSKGVATSKLSLVDRIAQEFSFNLQGLYYILTPADTKTEWGINFGHFVTQSQVKDNNYILDIFKKYLKAEIATYQQGNPQELENINKLGQGLRFFKDILAEVPLDLNQNADKLIADNEYAVNQAILNWINNNVENTYSEFRKNDIITPFVKKSDEEVSFTPIEEEDSSNKLSILFAPSNFIKDGLTEQEIKDLIKFANVNYIFNIMEQHKLFWGDPAQWKDITKRVKSFTSGRNLSVNSNKKFNDFFNKKDNILSYTDVDGNIQTIELTATDFGFSFYDDTIKTCTYQDVITENSSLENYDGINETDAEGWAFPLGYRQIRRRSNSWTPQDQEQFEWDNALCRRDNNLYSNNENGRKLKAYDDYILSKGNPFLQNSKNGLKTAVSNVLKPIYSGFNYMIYLKQFNK